MLYRFDFCTQCCLSLYMIKNRPSIRPWMLKKELIVLYYALKDGRTSWPPKLITLVAIIYLISPIDIIPDFIPVVGYLDDLVIVPILLNLAIRLLPGVVLEESSIKAIRQQKKLIWVTVLIALMIFAIIAGSIWLIWRKH
jgi:uncharacterized membrane protein YkvA (DUF1232 family)